MVAWELDTKCPMKMFVYKHMGMLKGIAAILDAQIILMVAKDIFYPVSKTIKTVSFIASIFGGLSCFYLLYLEQNKKLKRVEPHYYYNNASNVGNDDLVFQ